METGTTENASQDVPADAEELIHAPSVEEIEHLLETFDDAISEARQAAED